MKSRAGPGRALLLCLVLFCAATLTACTSTRQKIGAAVGTASNMVVDFGTLLGNLADVIVNGPVEDTRSAAEEVGIVAPAPAPAPEPAAPAPEASPEANLPRTESLLPLAPMKRPSGPLSPQPGSLRPMLTAPDLDPSPAPGAPFVLLRRT